jgi:hypothetical protein
VLTLSNDINWSLQLQSQEAKKTLDIYKMFHPPGG